MVRFKYFDSNIIRRSISGVAVASLILSGMFFGGLFWLFVVLFASITSLWEFYGVLATRAHISRGIGLIIGFIFPVMAYRGTPLSAMLAILAITSFVILFVEIVRRQLTGRSHAILNLGATMSGIVYVVLPWTFMILLRSQPWGLFLLITLFSCTWSCDVFAYLIGTKWGKTPFCQSVSPKKSWEGFLGGLAASLFCSGILAFVWEFPPLPLLLLGLLCGTAGQLGDLAESILKREAKIKDTGSLIPGHGGMLDRFDSILLNSSLAFMIFEVIWI